MYQPNIEIVIIFKQIHPFVIETIDNCINLNYNNFTILLIPDYPVNIPQSDKRIRIFPSGEKSIPEKRNIGIYNSSAKAEFIAYIDADAYPEQNWLINAVKYFHNKEIIAVGGPNLTPPDECFRRKISGFFFLLKIGFGPGAIRQRKETKTHISNELVTNNLIIRKSFLIDNPFDESLYTNEDTKLCMDIIKKGYKLLYAQDAIVFHHRRKILLPLLKQVYYYGQYKSELFLKKSASSIFFLLPAVMFLYNLLCIILLPFIPLLYYIYPISLGMYFLLCVLSSLRWIKNPFYIIITSIITILCHFTYGFSFLLYFAKLIFVNKKRRKVSIPVNK